MSKVAFIGLGVMGYPMAGHLVKKGGRHDVTVYNRTRAKADSLGHGARRQRGAHARPRPQMAPISSSPASATTTICARSRSARTARSQPCSTARSFVDHTTASADIARELYADAKEQGFGFLDAPVSGGQAGARERRH